MLLAYKKEISNIENDLKNFYYEEVEVGNKWHIQQNNLLK
jgi:hypothetical protein